MTEFIFFPALPAASTTFGLSNIACVTLGMSPGGVRKVVAVSKFVSGNGIRVFGGAMVNGVMLTGGKVGVPLLDIAIPCATNEVPCGMFASRATVSGSCGFVVRGILNQIPGSI